MPRHRLAALTPYRQLRAQYNAALIALYERTALPLDDIAAIAGVTVRAIRMLLCSLGARARHPERCRRGIKLRLRRGRRPKPLDRAGARRAVTAFRGAARRLRAEARGRARRTLGRAIERAARAAERAVRARHVVKARSVGYLATTVEGCVLLQRDIQARKEPEPTPEEQAALREDLARRIETMLASRRAEEERVRAEAERAAAQAKSEAELRAELGIDEAKAKRINEIAEEYYRRAEEEKGPRIRSLW